MGERRHSEGVRGAFGHRFEHAPPAHAQQIRNEGRQFEVHLFQQRLQPVLTSRPVLGELLLAVRERALQPLLRVGHKAEHQFLRYQSMD